MTATASRLDELTGYLKLNWHLFPVWPVNQDGTCACGKRDCHRIGKHPLSRLVKNGSDGATTDPITIAQWLAEWPDANWGVALRLSGLVDVAPDSPEWLAEYERRGLPQTATFDSGGGAGHQHFLYCLPEGCPTYRHCKTGQFDILSNGYSIIPPGLNETGRARQWLHHPTDVETLPLAPAWVVEELTAAATKTERAPIDDSGDEPPVRLNAGDLKRWTGEWVTTKPSGGVDRSESLWAIAKILARANAAGSAIAAALANRDQALGWNKYTGRSDAGTRYRETAARAIAEARKEQAQERAFAESFDDHQARNDDGGNDDRIAQLELIVAHQAEQIEFLQNRVQRADHQLATLRETHHLVLGVLHNKEIKAGAGMTAVAVAFEYQSAIENEKADSDGWVTMYRGTIAEKAGCSEQQVSDHIKRLELLTACQRRVKHISKRQVDPETGEIQYRIGSELQVKLIDSPNAMLKRLATASRPAAEENTWGGKRTPKPSCPVHPHADIIIRTTKSCAECGRLVEPPTEHREPSGMAETVECQDDISGNRDENPVVRITQCQDDISRTADRLSRQDDTPPRPKNRCRCGGNAGDGVLCSDCASAQTVFATEQRRLKQQERRGGR